MRPHASRWLRRAAYPLYYAIRTDWPAQREYARHAATMTGRPSTRLLFESLAAVWKYNASPSDYFLFNFADRTERDRRSFAGTGFMFEFQRAMNPAEYRRVLDDKLIFVKRYAPLVQRTVASMSDLEASAPRALNLLQSEPRRIVLKNSRGQAGTAVRVMDRQPQIDRLSLLREMKAGHFNMAEEYIVPHDHLYKLSPAAVNTVRLITHVSQGSEVVFVAARLRVSVRSKVDNLHAGGLVAVINLNDGVVTSPAVSMDPRESPRIEHPVTGVRFPGFQVPHWQQVLELGRRAALTVPMLRSVGWDIAVTSTGVDLIEGNHNWGRIMLQLPGGKGYRNVLTDLARQGTD